MSNEKSKNIDEDYETSRETYLELIEGGKESLELMIQVARESEHPRAFEVLSGMIKNVADVTDKLMELNKRHKEIIKEDKPDKQITNNNLFLGSTTELQRLLLDDNSEDEVIVDGVRIEDDG